MAARPQSRSLESLEAAWQEDDERFGGDASMREDPEEMKKWIEEANTRKQVMWDQYERAQRRKRELARGATPTPEDGVQISLADLNARKTADAGSARHTARATSGHASGYNSVALGDDEEGGDLSVDGAESRYAVKSSRRTSVKVVTKRPWPGGSGDALESIQESPPRKRRAIEPAMPTRSSPRKSVMAKAKGTTAAPAGPASSSSAPVAAAQPILPASHMTPPLSPTPRKGKGKAALPIVATHLPMDVDRLLDDIPTSAIAGDPPSGKPRLISDKSSQSMDAPPPSSATTRAPKRSGTAPASLLEGPSSTPDISSTKGNIATSSSRKKVSATTKPPTAAQLRKLKKQAEEQAKSERDALFARERQMKHPEFIAYLPEKAGIHGLPPAKERYLTGTVILYVHCEKNRVSEPSRARYWMLYKHGAEVVPAFSERVTHIVVERPGLEPHVKVACRVEKLEDIPATVKTYGWQWVVDSKAKNKLCPPEHHANYEMFPTRLIVRNRRPPQPPPKVSQGDDTTDDEDESPPSVTTASQSQPAAAAPVADIPLSAVSAAGNYGIKMSAGAVMVDQASEALRQRQRSMSLDPNDPLAEFYEEARFQAEDAVLTDDEDGVEVVEPEKKAEPAASSEPSKGKRQLKGFQCDNVGGHIKPVGPGPNDDIIQKIQELCDMHNARGTKDDFWRVKAYRQAVPSLRKHPTRIKSAYEAAQLHGVGQKTAQKIMEIVSTGDLQRLETERKNGMESLKLFKGIYGVGSARALEFITAGCRTLDDIRERKGNIKLTAGQEIGLRYYDELNDRMPRAEAGEIFGMIKQRALDLDPKLTLEIMGSYRRNKSTCGDIDILLTRDPSLDGRTHSGILRRLLEVLHRDGIVTEDLSKPHEVDGLEAKWMGIGRRDAGGKRRRIDILAIPWEQVGGALVYFTGDDIFNRSMRLKANKMGYSLNQRGLYRGVIRDSSDRTKKLDSGELFASRTEREIFDALGVPWQEPWERVRGG